MKIKAKSFNKTILLVEDESQLRKGISLNLRAENYNVIEFPDADTLLADFPDLHQVNLGIIDIMMPGKNDGLELCRELRHQGHNFPIIFLTARDRLEDKLKGFEVGGDDYLTKPFDLEELLARVLAMLKRSEGSTSLPAKTGLIIGRFIVDIDAATAESQDDGKIIRFNDREIKILRLLIENRGKPVSRDIILDSVWGTEEFPTNRTIDNYIVKFRKIFELSPSNPELFITRHGTGYELAPETENR